jgi:hypothetical protein
MCLSLLCSIPPSLLIPSSSSVSRIFFPKIRLPYEKGRSKGRKITEGERTKDDDGWGRRNEEEEEYDINIRNTRVIFRFRVRRAIVTCKRNSLFHIAWGWKRYTETKCHLLLEHMFAYFTTGISSRKKCSVRFVGK